MGHPRGMIGNRIEFRGTMTSIPRSIYIMFEKLFEAGFGIKTLYYNLIHGSSVLSEDEKLGALLVDMGGGQTNLQYFMKIKLNMQWWRGGEYVTKVYQSF